MNRRIVFRLNDEQETLVKRSVRLNPEIYMSPSHFVRVAIMRELNRKFKGKKQ